MENPEKLHIVMFPWLAFGHILPYLQLSKLIAQKGHRISFISTPRNIDRLPKLPPILQPLINLIKLPLPKVDNLPENAEATTDLPYEKTPYLKKAFDGLQEPLTHFLINSHPDWVVHDFAPHWLPPVLDEHGVSRSFFSIYGASTLCFAGSTSIMLGSGDPRKELHQFAVPPPWVPFPSNLGLPPFQMKRILGYDQPNLSGVSDSYRMGSVISACDVVAVRSCAELESEWLDLLRELYHKPVLPIGLLPPLAPVSGEDDSWIPILEWLDKQEKASVVYMVSRIEPKIVEWFGGRGRLNSGYWVTNQLGAL
uniref:UDP-rhamnose:rhamnosyltransferase 1 n=1 Tax=Vitis vinifera TaxID=29760 RepID=F6I731_VITVI